MGEESKPVVVYPSEIHKYAYCPRQYFFSLYMPLPAPLHRRIRMLLGRLYHAILGWISRLRGYTTEEHIERKIGNVILRGRPDAYKRSGDVLEIIERKSGRGPKKGVWLSDMLQASAYGFMLRSGRERVILRVEYRSGSRLSELDSDKIGLLFKIIDEIVMVKKYGIVPHPNRSPKRCAVCPYRDVCEELDRVLASEDLYEPGAEISGRATDLSFRVGGVNTPRIARTIRESLKSPGDSDDGEQQDNPHSRG